MAEIQLVQAILSMRNFGLDLSLRDKHELWKKSKTASFKYDGEGFLQFETKPLHMDDWRSKKTIILRPPAEVDFVASRGLCEEHQPCPKLLPKTILECELTNL